MRRIRGVPGAALARSTCVTMSRLSHGVRGSAGQRGGLLVPPAPAPDRTASIIHRLRPRDDGTGVALVRAAILSRPARSGVDPAHGWRGPSLALLLAGVGPSLAGLLAGAGPSLVRAVAPADLGSVHGPAPLGAGRGRVDVGPPRQDRGHAHP